MNSRQKGKRGERMLRDVFRLNGYDEARRTQQYCGAGPDASDVTVPGLSAKMHIECKFGDRINLYDAIAQASGDAKGKHWVVAHKRNHGPWMFTVPEETFFAMLRGDLAEPQDVPINFKGEQPLADSDASRSQSTP